ncbi:MAG: hypothetical protein PGN15_00590 [Aeromicrobium erythreum]
MSGSTGARPTGHRFAGPADAALREQWRRDRRALVRRHHPDAGGDAEQLQERLAALDRRYVFLERTGRPAGPPTRSPLTRIRSALRRPARRLRRRRYIDL